jgi:hypothetical protein
MKRQRPKTANTALKRTPRETLEFIRGSVPRGAAYLGRWATKGKDVSVSENIGGWFVIVGHQKGKGVSVSRKSVGF